MRSTHSKAPYCFCFSAPYVPSVPSPLLDVLALDLNSDIDDNIDGEAEEGTGTDTSSMRNFPIANMWGDRSTPKMRDALGNNFASLLVEVPMREEKRLKRRGGKEEKDKVVSSKKSD